MATSAGALFAALQIYGYGVKIVAGSFAPNGSSAVASTSVKGQGFTVAHSATGVFDVTLNTKYRAVLAGVACAQVNAATDVGMQLRGACDVTAATPKVQLANCPGGSDADISANANNRVHFVLLLASSDLNK